MVNKKQKARIIKRIGPDGQETFTIQQRHFLFRWWWVDATINSIDGYATDTFPTEEETRSNLCYFDGTPTQEIILK